MLSRFDLSYLAVYADLGLTALILGIALLLQELFEDLVGEGVVALDTAYHLIVLEHSQSGLASGAGQVIVAEIKIPQMHHRREIVYRYAEASEDLRGRVVQELLEAQLTDAVLTIHHTVYLNNPVAQRGTASLTSHISSPLISI